MLNKASRKASLLIKASRILATAERYRASGLAFRCEMVRIKNHEKKLRHRFKMLLVYTPP